jgi:hypothetical protein
MARECFRSSPKLEDMHTEGKIGQEDMKELMIDVVNRTYLFLSVLASSNGPDEISSPREGGHDPHRLGLLRARLSRLYDPVLCGLMFGHIVLAVSPEYASFL